MRILSPLKWTPKHRSVVRPEFAKRGVRLQVQKVPREAMYIETYMRRVSVTLVAAEKQ